MIDKVVLEQTCGACPEQYNAYLHGEYIGFLHLRNGHFIVNNKDGKQIYSASPKVDGIFEWDEREYFLNDAKIAIVIDIKFEDLHNF